MPDVYEDFTDRAPCQPFYFRQILCGPHENFHYVVGDMETKQAALIDPAFHVDRIASIVQRDGFRLRHAFFTHGHWDHIGGIPDVFAHGVEHVHVHEAAAEHPKVVEAGDRARLFRDGDVIHVGALPVHALHTPGHQPEGSCFRVPGTPDVLFGGDTLFVGSCGRTDFPGGDTDAMFESMGRLRGLDPGTVVMPGHHYHDEPHRTTGQECVDNPALATRDRAAFDRLPCLSG